MEQEIYNSLFRISNSQIWLFTSYLVFYFCFAMTRSAIFW
jgi:hypothetical protein